MTRPFLSAVLVAGALVVALWGAVVMVRNSVAVIERNQLAESASSAKDGMAGSGMQHMEGMGGRVAFAQSGRIAVAMGNGTMATFLSKGPGDGSPAWSPDGVRLAFVSAGQGDQSGIHIVEADVMGQRRVAPAAALHSRPSWSPDSRQLVFRDSDRERAGLYTVRADGSDLRQIFKGNANAPAWSGDGRWIAFSFNEGPTTGGLYVVDPDGRDPRVLLPGVFSEVAWSPDSRQIAVRGVPWPGGTPAVVRGIQEVEQVLTVERDTGQARVLTTEAGGGNWSPVWSPDGKSIACVSGALGRQRLLVIGATGGPAREIAQAGTFVSPIWSPDGMEIVAGIPADERVEARVTIVRADGSGRREFAPGELPSWTR